MPPAPDTISGWTLLSEVNWTGTTINWEANRWRDHTASLASTEQAGTTTVDAVGLGDGIGDGVTAGVAATVGDGVMAVASVGVGEGG
jgi:hypothetical protein